MNKKVMFLLFLLIAMTISVIAWAGDKSLTTDKSGIHNAAPVEKVKISTDLGKGIPYPGLSDAEKAKFESSKTQRPVQQTASTAPEANISKAKVAPIPTAISSPQLTTPAAVNSNSKPEPLTTDLGKDAPYSGLSPLEREKLQNEGSK
ncbi:MAG TPA: hypothetical protein DEO84_03845 [candidate division Zixibacteria bacterium]|nr:hypothetical protein [candidate division Zixibacteria bacterium]HBZ00436.1 hypothetical protein [candidate division Zixibacteria bacterium]